MHLFVELPADWGSLVLLLSLGAHFAGNFLPVLEDPLFLDEYGTLELWFVHGTRERDIPIQLNTTFERSTTLATSSKLVGSYTTGNT